MEILSSPIKLPYFYMASSAISKALILYITSKYKVIMPTIEAAIVGVSGESSQSIVNALLESSTPKYVSYLAPNRIHPLTLDIRKQQP